MSTPIPIHPSFCIEDINMKLSELISANTLSGRLRCVLKCMLGMSEEEAVVLTYMVVKPCAFTARELAKIIGRSDEVVRRALRKLYSRGLLDRVPYPLRRGGRVYLYRVKREVVEALVKLNEALSAALKPFNNITCMS